MVTGPTIIIIVVSVNHQKGKEILQQNGCQPDSHTEMALKNKNIIQNDTTHYLNYINYTFLFVIIIVRNKSFLLHQFKVQTHLGLGRLFRSGKTKQ